MVYCGKPSRGCQMCRQRRIKCDEGKPTCNQCQKSRRVCPGYKDDFDLVFRNETQATERRARKSTGKRINTQVAKAHQRVESEVVFGSVQDATQQPPLSGNSTSTVSVRHAMPVPLEQRATNFFLANFVLVGTNRAWFDYVIPLIQAEPADSALQSCFRAVSLASLGTRPNAKQLLLPAHEQYNRALRQVNNTLRDPATQLLDATVGSVLLLGLFEVITSRRINATAWGSHIDGAVMLVKLRGKKALKTPLGQSLFQAIRVQMLVNCLTTSKRPPLGADWWLEDAPKDEYGHKVTRLHLKAVDLRAEINETMTVLNRTPENLRRVIELMNRAQELDKCYADFVANVPEDWKYETVAWEDAVSNNNLEYADVCPGKVDLYTDIYIVAVWNNLRVTRLLLGGMIVRCAAWLCNPVDYRTTPEYACASRIGADMITDVCASIPFALGWKMARNGELLGIGMRARYACGDDGHDSSKGLGGIMAIWPLFSASCSDFATDTQRKWINGRLKYISEVMGVDQAKTFAHYELRLPSMIVKRDGFGLLAQSKALHIKAAATERNNSISSNYQTGQWQNRSPPSIGYAQHVYGHQASHAAYATPTYQSIPHQPYSSPPTTFDSIQQQVTIPRNVQPYTSAILTPPYRNNSMTYDYPVTILPSQTDFAVAQSRTQIDYEGPQHSHAYPGQLTLNQSSQNNQIPLTSRDEFSNSNTFAYQNQLLDFQKREREMWDQLERERTERETMAKEEERRQREQILEKGKQELIQQASGANGTDDMKRVMANYLAVDGVNITL